MIPEDQAIDAARAAAGARQRIVLREVFAAELPRLHALAYLATGDAGQAREALTTLWAEAPEPEVLAAASPDVLLATLARGLADRLGRHSSKTLVVLENTIRCDVTCAVDPAVPPVDGVEGRIAVLLGELRRRCLGWVVLTLPPLRRLAWILVEVLGVPTAAAAEMLNTSDKGLEVLLRRARKALTDYIEPRCGHLLRPGFCTCESRLGVALAADFVELPEEPSLPPRPGPFASLGELYRGLVIASPHLESLAPSGAEQAQRPRPWRGAFSSCLPNLACAVSTGC